MIYFLGIENEYLKCVCYKCKKTNAILIGYAFESREEMIAEQKRNGEISFGFTCGNCHESQVLKVDLEKYATNSWKEFEPRKIRAFQFGEEPEVMYFIKTGEVDAENYMVVHDDGWNLKTGDCEVLTKEEIKKRYKIQL
jgi:hypothetical protein